MWRRDNVYPWLDSVVALEACYPPGSLSLGNSPLKRHPNTGTGILAEFKRGRDWQII